MRAVAGAAALVAAGLVLGGCNKVTTGLNFASATCSVTLSGAKTGTYDCAPDPVAFNSVKDTSGYGFSITASGARPTITTAITWMGQPATTNYVNGASANALGGLVVSDSTGAAWSTSAAGGSFTLHITDVGSSVTSGNSTAYASTGTLTATLPALGGTAATGTITINVTF